MAYVYALINKDTLHSICEQKRITVEFLKKRTHFDAEKITLWITPSDKTLPTIRQAKKLANCMHIPFAGLYMNPEQIPMKKIPNIKNMRTIPNGEIDDSALNIAIIDVLLERDFLLESLVEMNEKTPHFSLTSPNSSKPEEWADSLRKQLNISLSEQFAYKSTRQFYQYLRIKAEESGVFINCFSDVPLECARGFAVYENNLPIIGINDEDRYPAKSFTLIHELVHILKRESSYCNDMSNSKKGMQEEIFCNAVAGEFLVPRKSLAVLIAKYNSSFSKQDIGDIAIKYAVSKEVIVRRLLDLQAINQDEYDSFVELFRDDLEKEKEEQRLARKNGFGSIIPRNMAREAFDRTSVRVNSVLYNGYCNDIFSKQDIARHLGFDQKHTDKYLAEVSKWSR